jgi:hypothetical protein
MVPRPMPHDADTTKDRNAGHRDPDYPDAWLREPYYKQIRQWAQQKPVEIRIGWRWLWLNPDLPESEMPKIQKWLEGGRA